MTSGKQGESTWQPPIVYACSSGARGVGPVIGENRVKWSSNYGSAITLVPKVTEPCHHERLNPTSPHLSHFPLPQVRQCQRAGRCSLCPPRRLSMPIPRHSQERHCLLRSEPKCREFVFGWPRTVSIRLDIASVSLISPLGQVKAISLWAVARVLKWDVVTDDTIVISSQHHK